MNKMVGSLTDLTKAFVVREFENHATNFLRKLSDTSFVNNDSENKTSNDVDNECNVHNDSNNSSFNTFYADVKVFVCPNTNYCVCCEAVRKKRLPVAIMLSILALLSPFTLLLCEIWFEESNIDTCELWFEFYSHRWFDVMGVPSYHLKPFCKQNITPFCQYNDGKKHPFYPQFYPSFSVCEYSSGHCWKECYLERHIQESIGSALDFDSGTVEKNDLQVFSNKRMKMSEKLPSSKFKLSTPFSQGFESFFPSSCLEIDFVVFLRFHLIACGAFVRCIQIGNFQTEESLANELAFNLPNLNRLDLMNLCKWPKSFYAFDSLKEITICNSFLGDKALSDLFLELCNMQSLALSSFTLIGTNLVFISASQLAQLLIGKKESLKKIHLENISATETIFLKVISEIFHCKRLSHICINQCPISTEGLSTLLEFCIQDGGCCNVECFDISDNEINYNHSIIYGLKQATFPFLTTFNISDNQFGDNVVSSIVSDICTLSTLRHINIRNCGLRAKGFENIVTSIISSGGLLSLNVSENIISNKASYDFDRLLTKAKKLQYLNISSCNLKGLWPTFVNSLQNCKINVLCMSENRIGDIGLRQIGEGLISSSGIQSIGLAANLLTLDGLREFMSKLSLSGYKLHYLDIQRNCKRTEYDTIKNVVTELKKLVNEVEYSYVPTFNEILGFDPM